uniref:Uncharacterized protein n=1 Tax=Ixodes ricinus TaxID=34613 RepID=A0A6B0U7T4_IXORI
MCMPSSLLARCRLCKGVLALRAEWFEGRVADALRGHIGGFSARRASRSEHICLSPPPSQDTGDFSFQSSPAPNLVGVERSPLPSPTEDTEP